MLRLILEIKVMVIFQIYTIKILLWIDLFGGQYI
jgi:hypothetical protein